VDGSDGTVRVLATGHFGPILTAVWPSCHPDRSAGWRESHACDLEITPVPDGVRIVERHGADELVGVVTLVGDRLRQEFSASAVGRVFQTIGLRQSTVRVRDGRTGVTQHHPAGLGLGVRDSSEIVAAACYPPPGSELTWTGTDGVHEVRVLVETPTGLVHSCLLDRRPTPGPDGVARLDTYLRVSPAPRRGRSRPATRPATRPVPRTVPAGGAHQVRMVPRAGGVTSWTHDGTRLLRSPYPHRRGLVCNPTWSAGMWVTTERARFTRDSGLGWGTAIDTTWEPKHPLGLHAPDHRISWELTLPDDDAPDAPVTVDLHHPDATEEVVLWFTPHTPKGGRVVVPGPDGVPWQLPTDRVWQRWSSAVSVELTDGRWLVGTPAPDAPDDAEYVVRSTAAGVLVGCVANASQPSTTSWHFTVRTDPLGPDDLDSPDLT
jgi:hypothetical protein